MNFREGHESKRFRLVGGLDVSADTLDHVFVDVDICCEMSATTPRDIITKNAEEHPDLKNVKTSLESIQKCRTNLLPHRIVNRTESGEILVLGELVLMNEHDVHELAKNADACGGCTCEMAARPQGWRGPMPIGSNTAGRWCEIGRRSKYATTGGGKALEATASQHAGESDVHDWVV